MRARLGCYRKHDHDCLCLNSVVAPVANARLFNQVAERYYNDDRFRFIVREPIHRFSLTLSFCSSLLSLSTSLSLPLSLSVETILCMRRHGLCVDTSELQFANGICHGNCTARSGNAATAQRFMQFYSHSLVLFLLFVFIGWGFECCVCVCLRVRKTEVRLSLIMLR